jgi:hypothetical protein
VAFSFLSQSRLALTAKPNPPAFALTTAATYRLTLSGIANTIIVGNALVRVLPAAAATAEFVGVLDTLAIGESQAAFTVRFNRNGGAI